MYSGGRQVVLCLFVYEWEEKLRCTAEEDKWCCFVCLLVYGWEEKPRCSVEEDKWSWFVCFFV